MSLSLTVLDILGISLGVTILNYAISILMYFTEGFFYNLDDSTEDDSTEDDDSV